MAGSFLSRFLLLQRIVALSLWKVVCCLDFCYSNGWQPCHYGMQSVVEIFVTPMDGTLVIMERSPLQIFLLLQWMVALSLWKVVCCRDFSYSNGLQRCHNGRQSLVDIFVTTMDGSLVTMEGSLLSIFLLLQWMVALSLLKVVCCRYFCYSNGWQPCHYGRKSVVQIFVTPIDGSLAIMEGSPLSRFLLLHQMVGVSLCNVVCSRYFSYSNGRLPCRYGRQSAADIFVTPMDGSLVIMEGSLLAISLLLQRMVAQSLWKVVCVRYFCYSN